MLKLETNKLCNYLLLTVTVLESDTAKMWDYFAKKINKTPLWYEDSSW
jgi:hypothetical protein